MKASDMCRLILDFFFVLHFLFFQGLQNSTRTQTALPAPVFHLRIKLIIRNQLKTQKQ